MKSVKKILFVLSVVLVAFNPIEISAQDGPIGLVVNGQILNNLPTPPVIRQDRMLVPARAVFENLGATVHWRDLEREVYIQFMDRDVIVPIDRSTIFINGYPVDIPVPAQIINENTMIPVAAVASTLGFNVEFRDRTVFVDSPVIPEIIPEEEVKEVEEDIVEEDIEEEDIEEYFYGDGEDTDEHTDLTFDWETETGIDSDYIDENYGDKSQFEYEDVPYELPSPAPGPVFVPVHTGPIVPARDLSSFAIPRIPHAETVIFFAGVIGDSQIFTISSTSPISEVETSLLEDNRLVIDILNSTTPLSGAMPVPPFLSVTGLRVSQFEDTVTRIVFDLESGTDFILNMTDDRTTITLAVLPRVLSAVNFEAQEGFDVLTLTGVSPSDIRVQPRGERWNIFIVNNQTNVLFDSPLDGSFASRATISRFSPHITLIELDMQEFTAHLVWLSGTNETSIRFYPASYRNIRYNATERALRIPKAEGFAMDLGQISSQDLYHYNQYILTLPVNAMEHIGFGEITIADPILSTVLISHEQAGTQFTFNGNHIIAMEVSEDEEHYIINLMHPREKYPRIIVIDPGHGGRFAGAVHNGIRETDLNMAIMEKLLHFIEAEGFIRAYTTRNTDRHFDENLATDLLMRSQFSNAIGDLFVSIHHNSVGNPGVHGLETYYRESPQDEFRTMPSRLLAEIMHRHLLGSLSSHDREVRSANFSVLRNSNVPAVLLELGFMSNPGELARMNTTEFQWQAARAVYDALLEVFTIYTPR